MERPVEILDTTLRDGEQTHGVAFTPSEKLSLAQALLDKVRVDRIEIASARVSEGELEAARKILSWAKRHGHLDRVEILGFIDFGKSAEWIERAGGRVINLLAKGSERHCRLQLRKSPEQHLEEILKTVEDAERRGFLINLYLEDWSGSISESPDYLFYLMDGLRGAPIRRFLLPDTLGIMAPDEVSRAIGEMCRRYPECHFDFHPHNDYGLATANVLFAVKAGARGVHCTVNCLGERAGNASLAEVVVVLRDKLHLPLRVDERQLLMISQMVERFSGKRVAANAPIVGRDVFTQTAGIHADGDRKGGLYQSRLRPERFGRRHTYALGKLSGRASLLKNLEALGIELSEEDLRRVLEKIVQLGDAKQTVTPEDLPFIIADVLESEQKRYVELLGCNLSSGLELPSTASIRLAVQEEVHAAAGSGNGGFDAFIDALRKVLDRYRFPFPELLDYEVRIPPGGSTGALTECIITWRSRDGRELRTRGVHANQVFAAISATMKMVNLEWDRLRRGGASGQERLGEQAGG